jgi:hypothetical protein
MKALTVWQPWAALIVTGVKDVENRNWRPPFALLGNRLAIHAGQRVDEGAMRRWGRTPGTDLAGVVVGTVIVTDCVRTSRSKWADKGSWHWLLTDPVLLDSPVPARGQQGLWDWTPSTSSPSDETVR